MTSHDDAAEAEKIARQLLALLGADPFSSAEIGRAFVPIIAAALREAEARGLEKALGKVRETPRVYRNLALEEWLCAQAAERRGGGG